MRVVSLQYHDVIGHGATEASGFPGAGPASYKLEQGQFERQCAVLSAVSGLRPVTVPETLSPGFASNGFVVTFDDGGVSAAERILDVLERYGWKGHFFVATDYIGQPAFLTKAQVRTLRRKGHVIGSHSCSHPQRMSHLRRDELLREWSASVRCLSDILGEAVTTASVPHGYYSRHVAEAASQCGIKALFTSEPVRTVHHVGNCAVFGRYVVRPGLNPTVLADLVRGHSMPWLKEFLYWNAKKAAKRLGGRSYLAIRSRMLPRPARHA